MDYAKPADVVATMIDVSLKKLALAPRDPPIRDALSGALLGAATSLAFGGAVTTGQPLVGAIIFPISRPANQVTSTPSVLVPQVSAKLRHRCAS